MGKQAAMVLDAALNDIEDDSTPLLPKDYWDDEKEPAERVAERVAYKIGYLVDLSENPEQLIAKITKNNKGYVPLEARDREDLINLGKETLKEWSKNTGKQVSATALAATTLPLISKIPNAIVAVRYAEKASAIMAIANSYQTNDKLKKTIENSAHFYVAKLTSELSVITVGMGQDVATMVVAALGPALIAPGMVVNIATGIAAKKVAKKSIKEILSLKTEFNRETTIKVLIENAISSDDRLRITARDTLKILGVDDSIMDEIDKNDDASRNKARDKLKVVFKW